MKPDLFIQRLQDASALSAEEMSSLEQVIQAYPCFAAAKELYLKALHQSKDLSYEAQLFKTSLASPHRAALYAYIHSCKLAHSHEDASLSLASPAYAASGEDAFSLIDSFLGSMSAFENASVTASENASATDVLLTDAKQDLQKDLQKDYVVYCLEDNIPSSGADATSVSEVTFADPCIQQFLQDPNERIATEDAKVTASQVSDQEVSGSSSASLEILYMESAAQTAWESLPADSLTLTLVKIYLKQKKYERALEILRSLSLNNPEKSIYFADQIRFLEKLLTHLNK